jgi:hypothetical protein
MNRLSKLKDIKGVTVSREPSAVQVFNNGEINMLVIPLELPRDAIDVMATITPEKAHENALHFRAESTRPDKMSLIDSGGDWGFIGTMFESHVRETPKNGKVPFAPLHEAVQALYDGHASSAAVVGVIESITEIFNKLIRPEHNHADLRLAYCFDGVAGLRSLPNDAANVALLDRLRADGVMLPSFHTVKMSFSLLSPLGYILASDVANTDWRNLKSWSATDDYAALVNECQQAAIDKVGGAELPFPAIVLSRSTENGPILMGPSPYSSAPRSVTGSGVIARLMPRNI